MEADGDVSEQVVRVCLTSVDGAPKAAKFGSARAL
jgi:hypothetical protein